MFQCEYLALFYLQAAFRNKNPFTCGSIPKRKLDCLLEAGLTFSALNPKKCLLTQDRKSRLIG